MALLDESVEEKLLKSIIEVKKYHKSPDGPIAQHQSIENLISVAEDSVKEIKKLREENDRLKITMTGLFESAERS